jgi:hypothetical protein
MRADNLDSEYYDPAQDEYTTQQLADTRKPVITLVHLNKLKKMRAARNLENLVRRDVLELLYGVPSEEAPPGM